MNKAVIVLICFLCFGSTSKAQQSNSDKLMSSRMKNNALKMKQHGYKQIDDTLKQKILKDWETGNKYFYDVFNNSYIFERKVKPTASSYGYNEVMITLPFNIEEIDGYLKGNDGDNKNAFINEYLFNYSKLLETEKDEDKIYNASIKVAIQISEISAISAGIADRIIRKCIIETENYSSYYYLHVCWINKKEDAFTVSFGIETGQEKPDYYINNVNIVSPFTKEGFKLINLFFRNHF